MKAFEYAEPRSEAEVLELLNSSSGTSVVLAGGTDLVGLLRKMVVQPDRVVNIMEVPSLREITVLADGHVMIGAAVTMDQWLAESQLSDYRGVTDAILSINSMQLQCQGTIVGDLCQRPRCWYFRRGDGLLSASSPKAQDHRFHAIFGNQGPAKFVSSSRLAPALITLGASLRIAGPGEDEEHWVTVADFFQVPRSERQSESILEPGRYVSHLLLPPSPGWYSATYDVKHGCGPDLPLASAAAALRLRGDVVEEARVVLGQVAPTPWKASEVETWLAGRRMTEDVAQEAGDRAVLRATPLATNAYKVQLARTAVKRALLRAAGMETGGL